MTIKVPQKLLDPTTPWFDPATGKPTREFFQYLREADQALRYLIAQSNPVTVANLPPASSANQGNIAFASNGRKNGEGAGSGTGVLVFSDGSQWRACDTGATVAA